MKKRGEVPREPLGAPMPPPDPSLADRLASPRKLTCRVCGGPGASARDDMLCWVCRRLKISAWRDVEKLSLPE